MELYKIQREIDLLSDETLSDMAASIVVNIVDCISQGYQHMVPIHDGSSKTAMDAFHLNCRRFASEARKRYSI